VFITVGKAFTSKAFTAPQGLFQKRVSPSLQALNFLLTSAVDSVKKSVRRGQFENHFGQTESRRGLWNFTARNAPNSTKRNESVILSGFTGRPHRRP